MNTVLLVKSHLKYKVQAKATDQHQWYTPSGELESVFSRELGYFIVRESSKRKPLFALFGVHFKSVTDRKDDPGAFNKRLKEAKMLSIIVKRFSKRNPTVPFLILGDFNAGLDAGDLYPIKEMKLIEPLKDEKLFKNEAGLGTFTHSFHPGGVAVRYVELDYILASNHFYDSILSADVYRYKDFHTGQIRSIPKTYDQRSKNPSDHFPVFIDVLLNSSSR
jgi:exonuclease III